MSPSNKSISMFDAQKSLAIEQIEVYYQQFQEGIGRSIEAAIEIGRILCEQKAALPHGAFLPWLQENVTFIEGRTCRRWMNLYRNREEIKLATVTNLTSAYRLLEQPFGDEEDVQIDGEDDPYETLGVTPEQVNQAHLIRTQGTLEVIKAVEDGQMDLEEAISTIEDHKVQPVEVHRRSSTEQCHTDIEIGGTPRTKRRKRTRRPKYLPVSAADRYASMAIVQLERIKRGDPCEQMALERVKAWIDNRLAKRGTA